ncbi:glycosyltransferase family 2 protein [Leptolyngbya sp. 7M]|uniref:glycosyltransferase family 2 protein n=1 Tax=Leptolyngbya sp. 7M TaxID=2812896 RepID=UPI001B8CEBC0|nr:glycosyltransferase family 2 protein [Leptolyngbya sp. 7M]QYO66335.1 glycosyltransferase family 2 protein [Leptolyngbya sp. 7M]
MTLRFDLTISISSFNRDDKIGQTLEHLFRSDISRFERIEVLVIDDGSPRPVRNVIDRMGPPPEKMHLRLIEQENAGIGATRNRGFCEARSDLVLFLDDDILVKPTTLNEFVDAQRRHAGSVVFGSYPFVSHETRALERFASRLYGYDRITEEPRYEKVDAITSGLLCVDRTKFGGWEKLYRDDLTIPAAEEHEVIFRFDKLKIPIVHARHIFATHNHHLELKWIASQQFKYGEATAEVFAKVPDIIEMERFARLRVTLDRLKGKGIKNFMRRFLASSAGRTFLIGVSTLAQTMSPNGDHRKLFGYLTTAYFWGGFLNYNKARARQE